MLKHYLIVALRNLIKYKMQTIISIIGLAVGLVSFALSGMWLHYEQTYDTFHEGADRVYVAGTTSNLENSGYSSITSPMLAQHLMNTFPEIESATYGNRIVTIENTNNGQTSSWKKMEIDSTFTSVLPLVLLEGSYQFLHNPDEIAITRQTALRIFGNESPIGKPGPTLSTTITAVVEGWKHTNYNFDLVGKRVPDENRLWNFASGQTLFRVIPGTDIEALKKKLKDMEVTDNEGKKIKYPVIITPLIEEHYTHPSTSAFIHIEHIRLFCIISLLIALSALANYLIMYLIRIRMRQREWALRKVNGASNTGLMSLLVSELLLLLFMSFLVALFLMEISLSAFRSISGINENALFFYKEAGIYMSIVLCIALCFAWLTLFLQNHFTLQSAISSSSTTHFSNVFRCIGLWFQLAISIGFIFCTIVMMQQLHHLRTSSDMGITHPDVEFVYYLSGISSDDAEDWVRKMQEIPGIEFHRITDVPLPIGGRSGFYIDEWDNKQQAETEFMVNDFQISKEAFDLLGMQLIQGTFPEDSHGKPVKVLVNEAFVRKTGWKNPIGKQFSNYYSVCGVVKDIQLSPTVPAFPSVFTVNLYPPKNKNAFTYHGSYEDAKRTIETYIQKTYPNFRIGTQSVAKMIEDSLASERTLMKLLSVASAVCIIIALFGIFSLISLSCEQRRKEIAIRKVNGATIKNIILIFLKEYMSLLVLAAIVAFPTGYIIMKRWLETYVIQTTISWWVYVVILIAIIIIILSSIGWRIWQAALKNPAEEIRTE